MLSVQAPGRAGMERLGVPGGARLHHDHRQHRDALGCSQQLEEVVGRILERQARVRSVAAAEILGLPPRIPLPDGEHGHDAHLQIRVAYQQAELTRCSVVAPPNKSVSDVPEWASECARRPPPGKKDGFMQKAVRYISRMGRPPSAHHQTAQHTPVQMEPAPCVMVPRHIPPAL